MQKFVEHRALLSQSNQEGYLLENSCLPGPRSNLELLYAFIEISEYDTVIELLNRKYSVTPVNVPEEFVLCCAVAACGKHIINGRNNLIALLKSYASDTRWRIRESVAMALQHIGKYSFEKLKEVNAGWEKGNFYEQRAIAAGLCEPDILNHDSIKQYTLAVLSEITGNLTEHKNNSTPEYKTLVQALCYCWSVAIVASPMEGKLLFEGLIRSDNKYIRKIVKENLKKNRLMKMDNNWVNQISVSI